jgi:hypothetical protein
MLVWAGAENLTPTGIRSPDSPARSQSLYWLSYTAHACWLYWDNFGQVNKITSVAILDVVHEIYQGVLYFQNVVSFQGTRVNVISFMPVSSTAFAAPIFTKLTNTRQRYVQTTYTKFNPDWKMSVQSMDRNLFTSPSEVCLSLGRFLWKLTTTQSIYVEIISSEYYATRILTNNLTLSIPLCPRSFKLPSVFRLTQSLFIITFKH